MGVISNSCRSIKLWRLLVAIAVVSGTLALIPNQFIGAVMFLSFEGVLLLAVLVVLVSNVFGRNRTLRR